MWRSMEINVEAYTKLIKMFKEEEIAPLVIESEDWEELIEPSFIAWIHASQLNLLPQVTILGALKYMLEVIYTMGYRRGQKEKNDGI